MGGNDLSLNITLNHYIKLGCSQNIIICSNLVSDEYDREDHGDGHTSIIISNAKINSPYIICFFEYNMNRFLTGSG